MAEWRLRRAERARPIAARIRQVVYLLWALLLVVSVTAVGAVQLQSEVALRLTTVIGPAFDANHQVLQAMTDAETGLRGYELAKDRAMLEPYFGARVRSLAAMAIVHDMLAQSEHDNSQTDDHESLESRQSLAAEQWWTFATAVEQSLSRGERVDVFDGRATFGRFRQANAALGEHITIERDELRAMTETTSSRARMLIIAVTVVALVVAFVMGRRAAHTLSVPLVELRATMKRQREGERDARAREDKGSVELRSLAADFNALTERNLGLYQAQVRALSLNELTFDIERAISATPDVKLALDALCAPLGEGLGADRVVAKTIDTDHNVIFAQWHRPDLPPLAEGPGDVVLPAGGPAEEVWRSTERLALDDFLAPQVQSQARNRIFHRDTGAQAVVVAPIGLGDRMIGVIYVMTVHGPRAWTPPEVSTVQQVAAFVAPVVVEAEHRAQQGEYVHQLEQLDRQRADFMATVSHELRTPLTSISGYLEVLQDGDVGELTGGQVQVVKVIDRNTVRLRSLIENLLVLNQIEAGGLTVDIAPVSMHELITHTGQELSPLAQRGGIELDIDAGPDEAIVQGDQEQLHRAVVNVVSNAIKFSHPGGVVTIRCLVSQESRRVRVTCQDHGIGIPVSDQDKLLTRFYRASNAREQEIPGTGLGLAIVKAIVQDHAGRLELTSLEGEGTTVVIDLPYLAEARSA